MKRILMLLIALLSLAGMSLTAEASVLFQQDGQPKMRGEAFSDYAAFEKVVLPEGVTHIGARAFAYSSLTEIALPASVSFIAEDAFEGCPAGLTIWADEGTYAWQWAESHGYFELQEVVIDLPTDWVKIDLASPFQIPYYTLPANAGAVKLSSSGWDKDVISVDENLLVTPLQTGFALIDIFDGEQRHLSTVLLEVVDLSYTSEGLQYDLSADGKGCIVTGCTGDPARIIIPAFHDGLPVVGFEPGAFKDCTKLAAIALEDGHTVLYMDGEALYADLPEKTLVCYPGYSGLDRHYVIPADTKAIAAYAFGQCWLNALTIPESVVSIGDCAFYGLQRQIAIYVPDSLTEFGATLFQSQRSNGAFYVSGRDIPAAVYAQKNHIPCGIIIQRTPEPTMAPTPTPVPTPTPDIPPVGAGRVEVFSQLDDDIMYDNCSLSARYDISALEGPDVAEVRLAISKQWWTLKYHPEMAQQTGLYGAGYTAQEAILRAYDKSGRQIGVQVINGNFTFAFDGALTLGVAGGSGTRMTVVPTRPVFITEAGRYPVQPEKWLPCLGGNKFQHFIVALPGGMAGMDFPYWLNILAYHRIYCASGQYQDHITEPPTDYLICTMFSRDNVLVEKIDQITLIFDQLECRLDKDELAVYAVTLPEVDEDLGERIYAVCQATRAEMLDGGHYPAEKPIHRVQVFVDGSYPFAYLANLWLNSNFYQYDDGDFCTIAHELIHAIDQSVPGVAWAPSPWMEGRAEYISRDICRKQNMPYTSTDYCDALAFDWSFLSEADRADFASFYFNSTNRNTAYPIGYYFYDFLIRTYGSDVGARVMNALPPERYEGTYSPELFTQCVESVTEPGVFQRFITDVVIPSGT